MKMFPGLFGCKSDLSIWSVWELTIGYGRDLLWIAMYPSPEEHLCREEINHLSHDLF